MFKKSLCVSVLLTGALVTSTMTQATEWGSVLNDLKASGQTLLNKKSAANNTAQDSQLSSDTIISGLKQALEIGSERAIETVSATDGFLNNSQIRIPLPPQVKQAGSLMRKVGMGSVAEEFETSMNRAAEKAAPEAKSIMVDAIKNMSIEDAKSILNGSDDAATQYFRQKTSGRLTTLFKPAISESLDSVGSTQYYNQLSSKVAAVPVVGQTLNVNLPDYVTQQTLNGLFTMLAAEEKKIRENPAQRSTELLKTVFGK